MAWLRFAFESVDASNAVNYDLLTIRQCLSRSSNGETWRQIRSQTAKQPLQAAVFISGGRLSYICYIDEAGCSAPLPGRKTDVQPLLVIAGLIVQQDALADITREFLALKRRYFPGSFKSIHLLDDVREEIKGSSLRSSIRRKAHHARTELRFIDDTLELLEHFECRILADIWVKGIAMPFKARETYTRSVQHACRTFQAFLESKRSSGFIVADFRTTQLNDQVAHSIFTQKYRARGDPFARILELPTFGVSNNHVGLQMTDVLCSALLFPMASSVYCFGHVSGVHVNARDLVVRRRYCKRLKKLQFKAGGGWSVWVSDKHRRRSSAELFVSPPIVCKGGMATESHMAASDRPGIELRAVLDNLPPGSDDHVPPVVPLGEGGFRSQGDPAGAVQ